MSAKCYEQRGQLGNCARVSLTHADAESLPFHSGSFDHVVCLGVDFYSLRGPQVFDLRFCECSGLGRTIRANLAQRESPLPHPLNV